MKLELLDLKMEEPTENRMLKYQWILEQLEVHLKSRVHPCTLTFLLCLICLPFLTVILAARLNALHAHYSNNFDFCIIVEELQGAFPAKTKALEGGSEHNRAAQEASSGD